MARRVLHIEIGSAEEALDQFAGAWEAVESGKAVPSFEGVGFETVAQLLGALTPKRWSLIERLRRDGPMTVYALAKALGRNYKNVHTDVKTLAELGIVERNADGKVGIPWDEIDLRVPLAA